MPFSDLAVVAMIALGTTAVVGLVAFAVLRVIRGTALLVQLCVVVVAAIVAVVASMIGVANAMYLSAHDLGVAVTVAVLSGAVSLLLAAALGWLIARNSAALAAALRRVGDGERVDARSVAPGHSAELAGLATELVLSSERLAEARERLAESRAREERAESARRELVASISHDLRTPLAGIRAMSEALEDGLADDPARYYRQMRSLVARLSLMVDDLFELSKIDSGTLRLSLQDVSLYDLVSDTIADLSVVAEGREIRMIEPELAQNIVIRADARELSRAIANLLVNALQHTPRGSVITVRAEVTAGQASISVIDSGAGIADGDLERVFEPGWRGSAARSPATPSLGALSSSGAGLGLAIVRGIAEAHRGEVRVRNVAGGCRFDLLLPAA